MSLCFDEFFAHVSFLCSLLQTSNTHTQTYHIHSHVFAYAYNLSLYDSVTDRRVEAQYSIGKWYRNTLIPEIRFILLMVKHNL